MTLTTYRSKRSFRRTPEPRGRLGPAKRGEGLAFVVQKHDATRLHYDFRLELDGVMKSWAIPKGPSLDPAVKRMAVHVEDHPLEYNTFEGVIPRGEYGGGPVLLWDRGRWIPEGDPREAYRKGRLKFRLDGEKLRGSWALVRTGGGNRGKEAWLLIKHRDEEARPGPGVDVVDALPRSVATGRTIEEIGPSFHRKAARAGSPRAVRAPASPPSAAAAPAETGIRKASARRRTPEAAASAIPAAELAAVPGARKARIPVTMGVALATLVDAVPEEDGWVHEIKYDGYRALCRVAGGSARMITRQGHDWTDRFAPLARVAETLPLREAWLDGEVVVVGPDGVTSFSAIQQAMGRGGDLERLVYYVFDLLHLDGTDLRGAPLLERKRLLAKLLHVGFGTVAEGRLRYSDHVEGQGGTFFAQACRHGLEGILSKRAASPYRAGRGRDWLKVKCVHTREFVIGGFTDPEGSRSGFGSLVLGEHDARGSLVLVGRVGTGFDAATLRDLHARLSRLEREEAPFSPAPRGAAARGVHWVAPELVAEVAFTERTRDGILRHPAYRGLREDKSPREIVGESAGTRLPQEDDVADPGPDTPSPTKRAKGRAAKEPAARKTASKPAKEAAAVRTARGKGVTEVEGVRITNPDKVLYPEQGITKRQLLDYYLSVQEPLMAYLGERPLTIVRCPDGHQAFCFFQKHHDGEFPEGLRPIALEGLGKEEERGTYFYATSIRGVLYLVQLGALELHVWGSRVDRVEHPDLMIFDLDPDAGLPWTRVVEAAFLMRDRLAELGLRSWPKTTGGKGLHVCVPLGRRQDWDEVKAFSKALVEELVRRDAARYTANPLKARRKGRVFLDYLRNGRGATAVSAWSTRARTGAPVSVPLAWDEVGPGLRPAEITIANAAERLQRPDPWAGFGRTRQTITAAMRRALGASRTSGD